MARDFLRECSEKENMLSNAIPDIIARLSNREDIPQASFQEIMKYVFVLLSQYLHS